ncbi:LOW QUALITY PROTEIN: hypothetical protein U0070_020044, partial [Myodes glareolus]
PGIGATEENLVSLVHRELWITVVEPSLAVSFGALQSAKDLRNASVGICHWFRGRINAVRIGAPRLVLASQCQGACFPPLTAAWCGCKARKTPGPSPVEH